MAERGVAEAAMAARPRVVAALAAQFRNLDAAEDGFDAAVEKLLASGTEPRDVAAFLFVAGKRSLLDARRKAGREARALADLSVTQPQADIIDFPEAVPDERLRLLFICCHPALGLEARVALTLRVVMGLEVAAIASGFLVKADALRQRITRAKAKIGAAGVPFELPHRRFWPERVEAVLMTLEQAFAAAYREGARPELAAEVERLARMLAELLPKEGEAQALAAMVVLARSREAARGKGDDLLALSEQDTGLWDAARIEEARRLLDAHFEGRLGRYRLLALIHLTHSRRKWDGTTDWDAIADIYGALTAIDPSEIVAVNRAVALSRAGRIEEAEAVMPEEMEDHAPWYAARADLDLRRGDGSAAKTHLERAIALTRATGPRRMLERRLEKI